MVINGWLTVTSLGPSISSRGDGLTYAHWTVPPNLISGHLFPFRKGSTINKSVGLLRKSIANNYRRSLPCTTIRLNHSIPCSFGLKRTFTLSLMPPCIIITSCVFMWRVTLRIAPISSTIVPIMHYYFLNKFKLISPSQWSWLGPSEVCNQLILPFCRFCNGADM